MALAPHELLILQQHREAAAAAQRGLSEVEAHREAPLAYMRAAAVQLNGIQSSE